MMSIYFLYVFESFLTFAIDASQVQFARQQLSLLINPPCPRLVDAEATLQEAEEALERHARQMVSRSVNRWIYGSLQYRTLNLRPWGGFELLVLAYDGYACLLRALKPKEGKQTTPGKP